MEVENNINYHQLIGSTEACTKSTMEARKGLGQKNLKGITKHFFLLKFDFTFKNNANLQWMLMLI